MEKKDEVNDAIRNIDLEIFYANGKVDLFKNDLKQLLEKHSVNIDVSDETEDGWHVSDVLYVCIGNERYELKEILENINVIK